MNKKQFGFGIIGAGTISRFHAEAINKIDGAILRGVYSTTKSKRDAFAQDYACQSHESLDSLLDDPKIDVVCICTPSGIHLEPALASIRAGKHCLIEKPLEITSERCEAIIAASKEANVKIGVIFPSRFYEAEKQLKIALEQKRFGDLVLGDAYVKWYRSPEYYLSGSWRGTKQFDGGGALMNQGIHSVDLLQWYMGKVKSVQAYKANIKHKTIEVEDTIVAALEFENGALGTIECSTAIFPGSLKRIEVRGTEGSVVIEEDKWVEWKFKSEKADDKELFGKIGTIEHSSGGGASDPTAISFKGHQMQIEDMIYAVENDREPYVTAEEGIKSVKIIEAIYQSAEKNQKIALK